MSVMNKEDLGYMAVFQSVIVVVGFFQTGVIHGGYRMISFSIGRKRNANNAVMSYIVILYILAAIILCCYSFLVEFNWFLVFGIIIGLVSLWGNWVTNLHIALGRTKLLSVLMFISIIVSMFGIPILYINPIYGGVLLLSIQPIVFIVLSFVFNKDFYFQLDTKSLGYIKLCLKYGFIPFFTGILYYLNLQVERAVIGFDLGIAALGEYYLVFVYTSVFLVIPGALATLNFPKMMKNLRSLKAGEFRFFKLFGRYMVELIAYLIVAFFATFWILPFVVNKFLPEHSSGVQYVHVIFWGLVAFTLADPITFIINAKLHYKQLLFVYILALFVSMTSYAFLYYNKLGTLVTYSYVNVLFFLSVSVGYMAYFVTKGRRTLYLADETSKV